MAANQSQSDAPRAAKAAKGAALTRNDVDIWFDAAIAACRGTPGTPRVIADAFCQEAEKIRSLALYAHSESSRSTSAPNEVMRQALQKIADDWPRSTNEGAQKWARDALIGLPQPESAASNAGPTAVVVPSNNAGATVSTGRTEIAAATTNEEQR